MAVRGAGNLAGPITGLIKLLKSLVGIGGASSALGLTGLAENLPGTTRYGSRPG